MKEKNSYDVLKRICTTACHERHACHEGFRQMLASGSVESMMSVWRTNWEDVVQSKYADIICSELPSIYDSLRTEMNRAGIYLNECPEVAPDFVLVLVTDTDRTVLVYDHAKAYVLGSARVQAFGHAQVYKYCECPAHIMLYDTAYGNISGGDVWVFNRARLRCGGSVRAVLHDDCRCHATGGEIRVCSCLKLSASGDAAVESETAERIELMGNATLKIITKHGER